MRKTTDQPQEFKSLAAYPEIKTFEGEDKGMVEHLVSVFGVLDMGRDVVHPGSFTKTIDERADRIRVVDTHRRSTITGVIGVPIKIWEISRAELPKAVQDKYPEATGGLKALTQFLMDTPEGRGAFLRIKAGAVSEFSFGYDTLDEDFSKGGDGKQVRNLRTLRLWEYGPVVIGMNPATDVVDVKSPPEPAPQGLLTKAELAELTRRAEEKAVSYTQHIKEVRSAFNTAYNSEQEYKYWIKEVFDEFLVVEDGAADYAFYQVNYEKSEDTISFAPRGEWTAGKYEFVAVSKSEPTMEDQGDPEKVLAIEIELEQLAIHLA